MDPQIYPIGRLDNNDATHATDDSPAMINPITMPIIDIVIDQSMRHLEMTDPTTDPSMETQVDLATSSTTRVSMPIFEIPLFDLCINPTSDAPTS